MAMNLKSKGSAEDQRLSLNTAKAAPDDLQGLVEDMGGLDMLVNKVQSLNGIQPREARIMHVRPDKW